MGDRPRISTPLKVQDPASGASKPVIRLNSVVLPAPFGPMRPVIVAPLDLEVVHVDGLEATEQAHHVVHDEDRVRLRDPGLPS